MWVGCAATRISFIYFGLPVGDSMVNAWEGLLERFTFILFIWKSKTISIRGRLTILRYVIGTLGSYYIYVFDFHVLLLKAPEVLRTRFSEERKLHWIRYSCVLASILDGG